MLLTKKIGIFGICATALIVGKSLKVEAAYLKTSTEFYNYYGEDFSEAEKEIVEGVFNTSNSFLETDGKQNLIDSDFLPFLFPVKGHGEHWFLPSTIGTPADPTMPTGYNVDENGQIVGAFWTPEKYSIEGFLEFIGGIDPNNLEPEVLIGQYENYKKQTLPVPTIFDAFGEQAQWHSHENMVFNNIGSYDPESIEFTQSLSHQNFVGALLNSLSDESIVPGLYEQDMSLSYPYFNSLIVPGFYMIHMWFGSENSNGLFANTNPDVFPNAIEEHLTFENGVSDHGHGHGHGHSSSESVPESSSIIGLLTVGILGIASAIQQKIRR